MSGKKIIEAAVPAVGCAAARATSSILSRRDTFPQSPINSLSHSEVSKQNSESGSWLLWQPEDAKFVPQNLSLRPLDTPRVDEFSEANANYASAVPELLGGLNTPSRSFYECVRIAGSGIRQLLTEGSTDRGLELKPNLYESDNSKWAEGSFARLGRQIASGDAEKMLPRFAVDLGVKLAERPSVVKACLNEIGGFFPPGMLDYLDSDIIEGDEISNFGHSSPQLMDSLLESSTDPELDSTKKHLRQDLNERIEQLLNDMKILQNENALLQTRLKNTELEKIELASKYDDIKQKNVNGNRDLEDAQCSAPSMNASTNSSSEIKTKESKTGPYGDSSKKTKKWIGISMKIAAAVVVAAAILYVSSMSPIVGGIVGEDVVFSAFAAAAQGARSAFF